MPGGAAVLFETLRIAIPAGGELAYSPADWSDRLVVVEQGSIELESLLGLRRTFAAGDVLTLQRMRLRLLRNRSTRVTVLTATARRR